MGAPFSADFRGVCCRARVGLKTAKRRKGNWARQKRKKKYDDDEIRTHAILEGFTPVAEKMDCCVSHFLTGIVAGTGGLSQRLCPQV